MQMRTPGTVHAMRDGIKMDAHTSGRTYEISPVCAAGGSPGVGAPVLQAHTQSLALALMQLTTGHIPWGRHADLDKELA